MAALLPFSESELHLLGALLRHKVNFMVVGLSAANLQGAPVVTQDVDLWFERLGEENMTRALREVGAAYVPPSPINPPMLAGKGAVAGTVKLPSPSRLLPLAKQRTPYSYDRCALFNCHFKVTRHTHAQVSQGSTDEVFALLLHLTQLAEHGPDALRHW